MAPIKILYIFTSGNYNSPNNKKWFNIFYNDERMDISILIQDCNTTLKNDFGKNYNEFYDIVYFKNLDELKKISLIKKYRYFKKISKQIDLLNPDIIHIQGVFYSYMVMPLFFLKIKPKIIYNIWGSDYYVNYFRTFKNRIILNKLFKKAKLIWTNWYALGDDVKEHFPQYISKIKTIPWGVESDVLRPATDEIKNKVRDKFSISENDYVMIYTRSFYPVYNHHKLLNALKYINSDLNFLLILQHFNKNEKYDSHLYEIIKQNNLETKVIISHDDMNDEEIKALFKLADLTFSLASKEQFSRTISEAIINDTNLIVNDIKPYHYLKDMFGFNIDLADIDDEQMLGIKISNYITNKKSPDWAYEKSVIHKVLNFDSKSDQFISIYNDLLKGKI